MSEENEGGNNQNDALTDLDDFDFYFRFIKPLVLELPTEEERGIGAAWAQKLEQVPDSDEEKEQRLNYVKLLLFVLQRGRLSGIFKKQPPSGPLQPLPQGFSVLDMGNWMLDQDDSQTCGGGDAGHVPYDIELSNDLREYAASQEIPNFGVQMYYAWSSEDPINKWLLFDEEKFPQYILDKIKQLNDIKSDDKATIVKKGCVLLKKGCDLTMPEKFSKKKVKSPQEIEKSQGRSYHTYLGLVGRMGNYSDKCDDDPEKFQRQEQRKGKCQKKNNGGNKFSPNPGECEEMAGEEEYDKLVSGLGGLNSQNRPCLCPYPFQSNGSERQGKGSQPFESPQTPFAFRSNAENFQYSGGRGSPKSSGGQCSERGTSPLPTLRNAPRERSAPPNLLNVNCSSEDDQNQTPNQGGVCVCTNPPCTCPCPRKTDGHSRRNAIEAENICGEGSSTYDKASKTEAFGGRSRPPTKYRTINVVYSPDSLGRDYLSTYVSTRDPNQPIIISPDPSGRDVMSPCDSTRDPHQPIIFSPDPSGRDFLSTSDSTRGPHQPIIFSPDPTGQDPCNTTTTTKRAPAGQVMYTPDPTGQDACNTATTTRPRVSPVSYSPDINCETVTKDTQSSRAMYTKVHHCYNSENPDPALTKTINNNTQWVPFGQNYKFADSNFRAARERNTLIANARANRTDVNSRRVLFENQSPEQNPCLQPGRNENSPPLETDPLCGENSPKEIANRGLIPQPSQNMQDFRSPVNYNTPQPVTRLTDEPVCEQNSPEFRRTTNFIQKVKSKKQNNVSSPQLRPAQVSPQSPRPAQMMPQQTQPRQGYPQQTQPRQGYPQQPQPSQVCAQQPQPSQVCAQQPQPSQVCAQQPQAAQVCVQQPQAAQVCAQPPQPSQVCAQQPQPAQVCAQQPQPAHMYSQQSQFSQMCPQMLQPSPPQQGPSQMWAQQAQPTEVSPQSLSPLQAWPQTFHSPQTYGPMPSPVCSQQPQPAQMWSQQTQPVQSFPQQSLFSRAGIQEPQKECSPQFQPVDECLEQTSPLSPDFIDLDDLQDPFLDNTPEKRKNVGNICTEHSGSPQIFKGSSARSQQSQSSQKTSQLAQTAQSHKSQQSHPSKIISQPSQFIQTISHQCQSSQASSRTLPCTQGTSQTPQSVQAISRECRSPQASSQSAQYAQTRIQPFQPCQPQQPISQQPQYSQSAWQSPQWEQTVSQFPHSAQQCQPPQQPQYIQASSQPPQFAQQVSQQCQPTQMLPSHPQTGHALSQQDECNYQQQSGQQPRRLSPKPGPCQQPQKISKPGPSGMDSAENAVCDDFSDDSSNEAFGNVVNTQENINYGFQFLPMSNGNFTTTKSKIPRVKPY